jgi:membrane protein YqaA with SNARE-associated domain
MMDVAFIQPEAVDFARIDAVLTMPLTAVVDELSSTLGSMTTAYIGNVSHTKFVRAWKNGVRPPRGIREQALRSALQATRIITSVYDANVANAWMFGANRLLGVEAPAYRLQTAKTPEDLTKVVRASWSFVTT